MEKRTVPLWLWYVTATLLVLADQIVKLWVRAHMELGETRPFIPYFIELYHVENTGAAFSLFHQHTWLLALLSAAVTVGLELCLWKDWFSSDTFSRLCLTLTLAGAVGNLIDRAFMGAVTDMFNFTFMRFGVFNVADICVVGGVIGYAGWLLLTQFKSTPKGEGEDCGADAERSQ